MIRELFVIQECWLYLLFKNAGFTTNMNCHQLLFACLLVNRLPDSNSKIILQLAVISFCNYYTLLECLGEHNMGGTL